MRRLNTIALIATLLALLLPACGSASQDDPTARSSKGGVSLKKVGEFDDPVYVTGAPGYPKLLFVVEQPGRVVVAKNGRRAGPSSTCAPWSASAASAACSRSPSPPTTPPVGASTSTTPTARATSGSTNSSAAARPAPPPARSRRVIEIPHPGQSNHNGGQLQFLGDLLYFGTGDGGSGGDPPNNAQNKDVPARQAAADRPAARRRPALLGAALKPVRRQAGARRDLQLRPAQPVPLLASTPSAPRSRGSRSATSARTSSRSSTTPASPPPAAPTSAGTPSRASPPTATRTAAPPTPAARSSRSSPTRTAAAAAARSSAATWSPTAACARSTSATSTPTSARVSCAASSRTWARRAATASSGSRSTSPTSFGEDDAHHLYVSLAGGAGLPTRPPLEPRPIPRAGRAPGTLG